MSVVVNALLEKYDGNRDGKLSMKEFGKVCYALGHYLEQNTELVVAFGLIDVDGSGEIDYDEFAKFWRTDDRFDRVRLDDEQLTKMTQMGDYFRYFDRDGSGALDHQEFANLCQHMEQHGGYDLKQIRFNLDQLDRDQSGTVTFNEYLSHMISLGVLDSATNGRPLNL